MKAIKLFGEVFQTGYIVRDMDASLRHWTETIGVGPFHIFDVDRMAEVRGEPMHIRSRMALSWWNEFQIELIMPLDDAPNPYNEFLSHGRDGISHLATISRDFSGTDAALKAAGINRLMYGDMPGTRIAYYDTERGFPGTIIEVVEGSDYFLDMLRRLKEATRDWNGEDPVRPIERLYA